MLYLLLCSVVYITVSTTDTPKHIVTLKPTAVKSNNMLNISFIKNIRDARELPKPRSLRILQDTDGTSLKPSAISADNDFDQSIGLFKTYFLRIRRAGLGRQGLSGAGPRPSNFLKREGRARRAPPSHKHVPGI